MIIGYIAGALTTIAFAPQLQKALTTKSTTDVSLIMLLCSTSGMILWIFYGIQIKDPAIVVANSISVVLASSLLCLKLKNDYASYIFKLGRNTLAFDNKSLLPRKWYISSLLYVWINLRDLWIWGSMSISYWKLWYENLSHFLQIWKYTRFSELKLSTIHEHGPKTSSIKTL